MRKSFFFTTPGGETFITQGWRKHCPPNDTLIHSWELQNSCSSLWWSAQVWRHAGLEGNRAGIYSQLQAHMSRPTPSSSSAPAGAMHIPTQPVIKMSLKPPPSLVILWNLPPTEIPVFLRMTLLFRNIVLLLSIFISDIGDVTGCLLEK